MSNTEISVISRKTQVAQRERFLVPKNVKIFTQSSYDSTMPGIVGLSIFVEGSNDGNMFSVGKTKSIQAERLPKIREALDSFGQEFTKSAMKQTSDSSFKSILSGILDNVLSNETNEKDED